MESKLLNGVLQTNTTVRLQVADDLLKYLLNDSATLSGFEDVDQLVVGLVAWLGSSHFKVSINAMEILVMLCEKDTDLIKRHITDILPTLRERLGDLKEQVRVHATQVFMRLMDAELQAPQTLLEEFLAPALGHKNWRVKEEGMQCLTQVLAKYGGQGLALSKFVGTVCRLLEDPNPQVRAKAVDTLVAVYKTVGEKVRTDLNKRGIPQSRLGPILAKFDEALANGAVVSEHTDTGLPQLSSTASASSVYGTLPRKKGAASSSAPKSGLPPPPRANGSGGLDEMDFQRAFDETPTVQISSARELEKELTQIQLVLEDDSKPWDMRVQSLKRLRGIMKGGALDHKEFHTHVKTLEGAMLTSVKDLRSQVCREACITLSYFTVHVKESFELIAQSMLGRLILLLPNSAKVMSSSANTCIKYFIGHIHGHHLIPPITQACESKSSATRRFCAEYIDIITHTWEPQIIDRQLQQLEKVIGKGVSDADAQARQHMRRAFWGLYLYFPDRGEHIFQSFAPAVQRRLSEERESHNQPINSARKAGMVSYGRKSALGATSEPDLVKAVLKEVSATDGSQPGLSSASSVALEGAEPHQPNAKVKRAKTPPAYYGRKVGESQEGSALGASGSKPSSGMGRTREIPSLARPSSSLGMHQAKKGRTRLKPPSHHMSRSVNPSPAQSRESSPPRFGGGIGGLRQGGHRIPPPSPTSTTLTKEAMLQITSQFGSLTRSHDDEDETGSVGSAMSMSSEASFFSPYTKFRHPIQNVSELFQLSSSHQWGERRDALAQLQLLLEGERDLSAQEKNLIKEIIRRMLVESHIKVYGVFLDVLNLYIAQYKEELEEWLFKILLRLLHKKGADMLSTVHRKLSNVLVQIRTSYSPASQLRILCQIVVDKAQPMTLKTKVAWLEYFIALVDLLDPTDFTNGPDTRQALSKVVAMCTEPKSAEIRKLGKRALIHLFQFNTAILTRMIQGLPQQLQDTADTVLKSYTMTLASSGEESSDESPISSPVKKTPSKAAFPGTPRSIGTAVSPLVRKVGSSSSSSSSSGTPSTQPHLRKGSADGSNPSTLTSPMLRRSTEFIASPPDRRAKTPGRTGIPTPSQHYPRAGATPRESRSRPTTPSSAARRAQRPKSTDPLGAYSTYRPSSSKSDYIPGYYMNGQDSLMSKYAMGRLTQLNFGDEEYDVDHVARALKQLTAAANNVELRIKALQLILSLAHTPERCNWDEHSSHLLHKLMELMQDESGEVKVLSLRVFREIIRAKPDVLKNVTELVITKIMKSCLDKEAQKTAAEDVVPVLAGAVDPAHAMPMLVQTLAAEEHPGVLAPMKMISLLLPRCSKEQVLGQMKDLMASLLKLYGHSESTIRKSSVFCLVAVHKVVREDIDPYLETLTPSQRKLLDIYIKKSESSASLSSTT